MLRMSEDMCTTLERVIYFIKEKNSPMQSAYRPPEEKRDEYKQLNPDPMDLSVLYNRVVLH